MSRTYRESQNRSTLVQALDLSEYEFRKYTKKTKKELKAALRKVIFKGYTYTATGYTKQAIYSGLRKLYWKKYGEEYTK